jgi:hypothetical protein
VHQLAFPSACARHFLLDQLKSDWEHRFEQHLNDSAHGMLGRPSVQLFRAAIPVLDGAIHIENDNGVMREI